MEQSLKNKILEANNLIKEIELLNNKIKVYEDFKNSKDLNCQITRPGTRDIMDYSYVDKININDKSVIIEVITNLQNELKNKVEAKELALENLSI